MSGLAGWRRAAFGLVLALTGACAVAQGASCPPAPVMPGPEQIQAAQRSARDHGFLWRISKDGRTSYLYGTLHVGKLDWAFPGPLLRQALAGADALAVEVDLTDPAVAQAVAASAVPTNTLPAALQQRLQRQIAAACLGEATLAALHPLMQAITLTVLAARWEGLDAGYAQEIVLGLAARARPMPIISLETAQAQLALLLPEDATEQLHLLEQMLDQLEQGRVRPVMRRLAAVWAEGRIGELEDYAQWCDCADTPQDRAFLARLNDARNAPMAERIDALHRGGQRLLVAVGALHMTGEQGLPRLLAARGYRVERLRPPASR